MTLTAPAAVGWAERIVASMSYKLGVEFEVRYDGSPWMDALQVTLVARVPDVITREPVRVANSCHIPAPTIHDWMTRGEAGVREFQRILLHLVLKFEDHEAREWLAFGGERVFDPHAKAQP